MSDLIERLRGYRFPIDPKRQMITVLDCKKAADRIEALEKALTIILANTEPDAIPHIAYNGMTAYQALAKDIADCALAALAPEQEKP